MSENMREDLAGILISEEKLHEKVGELGAQISRDFEGKNPLLLSILKGSFVFMADLARSITIPCSFEFMAVSSYGKKSTTTGAVKITKDLEIDIENRHIIVVEDILDSGVTLNFLMGLLQSKNPASITLCTLLDKPSRRKVPVKLTYSGFEIPDEFVVGYGLDYAEKYRNLPYIGILAPRIYEGE